jgi:hypothetical protein
VTQKLKLSAMDEQPETAAGPANDETEAIFVNDAETQQEWRAWSNPETGSQPVVDYGAEPRWRGLLPKVLASAAAVAIGAIAAVMLMPDHHQPPSPKAVPPPPTFHESVEPTPPSTVTIQTAPPTVTVPAPPAPKSVAEYDKEFLARQRAAGYVFGDPAEEVALAHVDIQVNR